MNISRDLPREGPPARITNISQEQRNVAQAVRTMLTNMTQPPGQPTSAPAYVSSSQEPNLQASTVRSASPSAAADRSQLNNTRDLSQQLQIQLETLRSAETPPVLGNLASLQDQLDQPTLPLAQSIASLPTYEDIAREGSSAPTTVTNKSAPQISLDRVSGGSVEASILSAPAAATACSSTPCSSPRLPHAYAGFHRTHNQA